MILVTGGSGFIGKAVVRRLRELKRPLRVFDMRPPAFLEESDYVPGEVEFVRGDVTYAPEVRKALGGVSTVIHLAAHLLLCGDNEEMRRVNVEGTRTLLELARRSNVDKVVYTSTGMLYGPSPGRRTLESDPAEPSGPYGRSKVEAEAVCQQYLREGRDITILRPLFVLGEGRLGVLHLLFDRVSRGRPIYMVGDGSNRFHMIGVDDLAGACVLAATSGPSGIFNVGVEEPTPVRDQMEALREHAGTGSAIRALPRSAVALGVGALGRLGLAPLEGEHQHVASQERVLDVTKAREELGWRASRSDVEMLLGAYDWYLGARKRPGDHRADWPDGGILKWRWLDRLI